MTSTATRAEDDSAAVSSVRDLIERRAAETPHAPFLVAPDSGIELDYAALAGACAKLGRRLAGLGIGAGERVAFLLDNGAQACLLFLGTMHAGRVTVPVNAVAGPLQMRHVIEHSQARVVFVGAEHRARLDEVLAGMDPVPLVIDVDEHEGPRWPAAASDDSTPPPHAGQHALLLYTSGTTGLPKGAELSHANVLAGGANTVAAHRLGAEDRALCVLPLYHINGEIVTVMGPLASGGSVVMPQRFRASRFWDLAARYHCTWLSVVPTIVSYLLDRAGDEPYRFGSDERLARLRFARCASAALSPSTHEAFERTFGLPMIETMGLTETCAAILSNPLPPAPRKIGSPGIAFGNEVRVTDASGRECAVGEPGELVVRGPNVLARYFRNEAATASAFRDGWFRTGDLGYRDEDGYFFITGRLKELIIKGGENIAPREIDDVLYRHPAVLEAAAFGVPHAAYGQDVLACVALRDGHAASETELRAFCEQHLGRYKTPTRIHFMRELPKGPSGKIQRLKLPELIAGR